MVRRYDKAIKTPLELISALHEALAGRDLNTGKLRIVTGSTSFEIALIEVHGDEIEIWAGEER